MVAREMRVLNSVRGSISDSEYEYEEYLIDEEDDDTVYEEITVSGETIADISIKEEIQTQPLLEPQISFASTIAADSACPGKSDDDNSADDGSTCSFELRVPRVQPTVSGLSCFMDLEISLSQHSRQIPEKKRSSLIELERKVTSLADQLTDQLNSRYASKNQTKASKKKQRSLRAIVEEEVPTIPVQARSSPRKSTRKALSPTGGAYPCKNKKSAVELRSRESSPKRSKTKKSQSKRSKESKEAEPLYKSSRRRSSTEKLQQSPKSPPRKRRVARTNESKNLCLKNLMEETKRETIFGSAATQTTKASKSTRGSIGKLKQLTSAPTPRKKSVRSLFLRRRSLT